jgi:hypothetical protein
MYALTDAAAAELKRRDAKILADRRAGKLTAAEAIAARSKAIEELGTLVRERLVRRAIRKHGHRGLGALDVAASRTLASASVPPRCPARPRERRPARRTARRASRDGPDEPPPEPEPPLRVIPLTAFRRELRARGGRA